MEETDRNRTQVCMGKIYYTIRKAFWDSYPTYGYDRDKASSLEFLLHEEEYK